MAKRLKTSATSNITAGLRPLAVAMEGLTLDPANAKDHGEDSIAVIVASLKRYGQRKNIVVNATTGVIEAGNGTYLAAKQLGWTEIAALLVKDDESTATGYALADNRSAEFSAWNQERLAEALEKIDESDDDLVEAMRYDELFDAEPPAAEPEIEITKKHALLIECTDEGHQRQIYQRLQAEGFPPAKVLTI